MSKIHNSAMRLLILSLVIVSCQSIEMQEPVEQDWRTEWGIVESFSINEVSSGFKLPTSIAFVPDPGSDPKDPLYFVTELFGTLQMVTNDGTVISFAQDLFYWGDNLEFEETSDEHGLAGVCLAPEQGFIFVTFSYRNPDDMLLYNGIIRFDSKPKIFSNSYSSIVNLSGLFDDFPTAPSHQIGACVVNDNILYVSVGDGRYIVQSQQLSSPNGKILRMDLNGNPFSDNPFATDLNPNNPSNYIWAYGLRNPFALSMVGERIFVADNGQKIDRLLEIHKGENYLWDGDDWSIGSRNILTLYPGVGPASLDFLERGLSIFPEEYASTFYLAMSVPSAPGIMQIRYSLNDNRASFPPADFLSYRGNQKQILSAMAFGPDGLYFAPLLPAFGDSSSVYKITYDPKDEHPYRANDTNDPERLMREYQCLSCHSIGGEGGEVGPKLDRVQLIERLEERLNSEGYLLELDQIDKIGLAPFTAFAQFRKDVRMATGEDRVRTWMVNHLIEPKFDNPDAQMPNLGLSQLQAENLTDYLVATDESPASQSLLSEAIDNYILDFSHQAAFIVGILLGLFWPLIFRRIRLN